MIHRFLMICVLAGGLTAQERLVTGVVLDAQSGLALAGATVMRPGSRIGAAADEHGRFAFRLPQSEVVLEARLLGYSAQSQTVPASDPSPTVTFRLQPTVLPLQSMLVTASRSREQPFDAGYANLQQQQLQERYSVQDIPALLSELPSTTFYSEGGNGLGYTYLNIRGFDQRRIAVMVNGVPQNDPEDHSVYWLDFPDLAANLENIQVQRGAGGLFGAASAIGGAVNLISSNFTRNRGISVYSGAGSYNTRKYSLSAGSGLMDNRYALYARLGKITSDGYRDNSWVDFNSYFLGVARFDKGMTSQINLYGGPVSDHLAYYGISRAEAADKKLRTRNPIQRKEEIENFSQPHYEIINEWQTGRWKFQNTLFYVAGEGFYDYDGSWAPYSYYRITPENGFAVAGDPESLYISDALIHAYVKNGQAGWLPRAALQHDRGVLTVGAEWRRHRSLHYGSLKWGTELPAGVTPDYRYYEYRGAKNIASLFVNEVYRATERLTCLADAVLIRQSYRLYDEKYLHTDFTKPYLFFNPKLGVSYLLRPDVKVYSTFARTSREPRLKNLYDAAEASTPASWGPVMPQFALAADSSYNVNDPLVKEETMFDWEAGAGLERSNLHLSVNAYYMIFLNEIVKSGRLDRFGQPVTGNAERTLHRGIELAGMWRPSPGWELSANSTLSYNRLVRHRQYTWAGVHVLDGKRIAGFPDVLANARLSYRAQRFSLSMAGRYVGAFYTSNLEDPQEQVPAFALLDFHGRWRVPVAAGVEAVELQLQVNNVLNKLYVAHGEGDAFFPAAERNVFLGLQVEL